MQEDGYLCLSSVRYQQLSIKKPHAIKQFDLTKSLECVNNMTLIAAGNGLDWNGLVMGWIGYGHHD